MVIYSWNMLHANKELDNALEFIRSSNFDIFCLQEVPEEFLVQLKTLPYNISYVEELKLSTTSRAFPIHCVTLSKYPIVHRGEIACDSHRPPMRTKLARYLLGFLSDERVTKWEHRKSFFADLQIDSETVRVFNLHLPLTYPHQRMGDLIRTMSHYDPKQKSIICGDFNILDTFYISLLNWLLGGHIMDWIWYRRERISMEKYFRMLHLQNPLRKQVTHPIAQSQLDHILIQEHAKVISASVVRDRYGSDHCPLRVEVEL